MYYNIKEKLKISSEEFAILEKSCDDWKEIFDDYESLLEACEQYESDMEIYKQHKELLLELEEEVQSIVENIRQTEGNT